MASVAQPAPAATCTPTPDIVGNAFVHQYYHILHQSPELVHRFYQDISKLGRPEENGMMSITSTLQAINVKILSLDCGVFMAEISTVDTQESYNGGVLVLVTGYLTGKDNIRRKFTQTFFLAPQEKGYFVLNDMFRYFDEAKPQHGNVIAADGIEASVTPRHDPSRVHENHVQENHTGEQQDPLSKGVDGGELLGPPENGHMSGIEEKASVPEVVNEAPSELQEVAESNYRAEEVSKRSYASIVMKENTVPASAPRPPSRVKPKWQEQPVPAAPPLAPLSEKPDSNTNATENGNDQDGEVVGPSIYVKGLPLDATPVLLENEFKKFGPIKSGGIQVRSQKGFCFGFVEFEMSTSVQSALEASPVMIDGRRVFVEEKRSTSRGSNRARSYYGSGSGYRVDGGRGRGNYGGGRGYGRGEFNNRAEFGNRGNSRGGFGNHGGDRPQRTTGGGRVNRSVGLAVNPAAKSVALRVTATA